MRSTTLSLISLLPFMGHVLGSTACKPKSTESVSASITAPAVAAVATDGTELTPASGSATSSAINSEYTTAIDTGNDEPTMAPGTHSSFTFKQQDKENCDCGYKVSGLGDIYMPFKFQFNFSSIPDSAAFSGEDDLKEFGWRINQGHHVGGPSSNGTKWDGTKLIPENIYQCLGDPSSLSVKNGNLQLIVKGGQTPSDHMNCPEIIHNNETLYGIFQSEIQFSDVTGTCQAFWLNHTIAGQYADELDIEVLGGAINKPNDNQPNPGLWSTNWDPNGNPNDPLNLTRSSGANDNFLPTPFPNDPTKGFNTYTIAWVPGEYSPRYYNGQEVNSPTLYNAIHPQELTVNNWSNHVKGWSGEVPQEDSIMLVKSVLFYYRTEQFQSLPEGCKAEDVCIV
ncbi:uncharacterized protein L201_006327 [Kwoniella dendrophila CBS 6074]|uniref:GH16 domain-containing protein n=1 Tax=Kwoniella dendrophila CBS 6074 TaxID=1295534 RepID=A0AAX4K2Q7_9TREE